MMDVLDPVLSETLVKCVLLLVAIGYHGFTICSRPRFPPLFRIRLVQYSFHAVIDYHGFKILLDALDPNSLVSSQLLQVKQCLHCPSLALCQVSIPFHEASDCQRSYQELEHPTVQSCGLKKHKSK